MANDKRFLAKNGLQAPNISFSSSNSAFANSITATFLETPSTISFSGLSGQLFSITDSMAGSIYAVNDISGFPSIEVFANGQIDLAPYGGKIVVGNTASLQANGTLGTAGQVLHSNGSAIYWAADDNSGTVTSIATANGLSGGTITTTGTLGVTTGSTLTVNTTGIHVNSALAITSLALSGGVNAISFTNATSNWLAWNTAGFAAPATTTRSAGTKLVLYPALGGSSVDYALGIEGNHLWFSTSSVETTGFKWYTGTTNIMTANAAGLNLNTRALSGVTTAAMGNTTITGFANVTSTIQGGSSLTIAGAASGITTLAAGNTTLTGFANVSTTLQVGTNTATFGTAAYVVANGNVGIGTATPGATYGSKVLQVNGTADANAEVRLTHTTSGSGSSDGFTLLLAGSDGYVYNRENGSVIFGTGNIERMRITSSGNVGIGTSSPATKLVVSNSGAAGLEFEPTGGISNGSYIQSYNRSTAAYTHNTNYAFAQTWYVGNGSRAMDLTSSGNVGIGTTAPGSLLHVSRTLANDEWNAVTLSNKGSWSTASGKGALINVTDSDTVTNTVGKFGVVFDASSYGAFVVRNLYSGSYGASGDVLYVRGDGNVGIGNTTPGHRLSINAPNASALRMYSTGANTTLTLANDSNVNEIRSSTGRLGLYHNVGGTMTEGLTLVANGNVGIGTSSPNTKLAVEGSASEISINDTAGTIAGLRFRTSGTTKGVIQADTSSNLRFSSGATERMRIDSSGNVGIGTSSPGYKLEVNGSFAATTKSFVIPHPTKPGMKLRYGSLEGPENGVYVRGRLRAGENTIQLPDYWEGLVDEDTYTVNLTPVGKHQELYVEHIASDHIIIGGENIDCFYTVFAERNDVEKLVVEF